MPFHEHLPEIHGFEPASIAVMSQAFADACGALPAFSVDDRGRDIIARRIIDLARTGVLDATLLVARVVCEARVSL